MKITQGARRATVVVYSVTPLFHFGFYSHTDVHIGLFIDKHFLTYIDFGADVHSLNK